MTIVQVGAQLFQVDSVLYISHNLLLFKKLPMHPKTGGMGRINDIAIRYVAKLSGKE